MENENLLSRLQRRATIAVVLLGLCAVADLAAVAFDAGDHHLVNKLRAGASVSLAAAATADNRVRDLGVIQIVLFIATAIAFIAWFSLAYRNLERLFGVLLRWDKGWAIGAWFVPILSLVRPKRIANFIWRGSDPSLPANFTSPGDAGTPVPWFYNWWWGAFLVSAFAARIGSVMQRNAKTLPSLGSALNVLTFADALDFVAAILAIVVVTETTRRQRARAAVLAGQGQVQTAPMSVARGLVVLAFAAGLVVAAVVIGNAVAPS